MTLSAQQSLKENLHQQLAFNLGQTPIRYPKGAEEIKVFRIYINVLRRAETDYLSNNSSQKLRVRASQALFGLHLSPLPSICRILNIDCHQARLKIIEWRMKGIVGDPIFDFLTKLGVANQYEIDKLMEFSFTKDNHAEEESD